MEKLIKDTKDNQVENDSHDKMRAILEKNKKEGERAIKEFWKEYFKASYASRNS